MIPNDEFSVIVAGTVEAETFYLVDSDGNIRFTWNASTIDLPGPATRDGYGLEYEDPDWIDPLTRGGILNSGDHAGSDDYSYTDLYAQVDVGGDKKTAVLDLSAAEVSGGIASVALYAQLSATPGDGASIQASASPTAKFITLTGEDGIFLNGFPNPGAWIPIKAPAAGWTALPAPNEPAYRIENQRCFLRGIYQNTSGGAKTTGSVIVTSGGIGAIPSAPATRAMAAHCQDAVTSAFSYRGITADTALTLFTGVGPGDLLRLDGCSYERT